ncbi:MAG: MBL fold metallo-hydrolase, partial [Treponema sp.]|nr:MBL fold metallo-hydrolase [Treponema sp.]
MKVTILGSGTSQGIPVPGCDCPVCHSSDRRDNRTRASVCIEDRNGETAVIDTGPEFRIQALEAEIKRLDAVFLSHAHADHVHGFDDIRPFSYRKPIPVYGNRQTIGEFMERFAYIFKTTQMGGGKPRIEVHAVSERQTITLGGLVFCPVLVRHGVLGIFGWKISENRPDGSRPEDRTENGGANPAVVYLTDVSNIPEDSFGIIGKGGPPEFLIIDGLRKRPHETHFSFDEAFEAAFRIGAGQTYLTHICHEHSHREIEALCREFTGKKGLP